MYGPTLPFPQQLHGEKYREPGEGFKEAMNRVANSLKDSDDHYYEFREVLLDMRFMPAGRVQAAMGASRRVTPWNCLAGSTLILTREHGAVPIATLAGQKVQVLDGNGNWTESVIYDHGFQETATLTFKGGFETIEIRSTPEHGWIAADGNTVIKTKTFFENKGKREVADLRPSKDIDHHDEDYQRGVLHGLIYGDGTQLVDGAYQLRVCGAKSVDFPAWLDNYGSVSFPPSYNGDPVYRFVIRTDLEPSLKQLPERPGDSLHYLLGFLRGWFAADGCVSTQPEATICGDFDEMVWIERWGPLVGWHVRGWTSLASTTNFGERKKTSLNIRLKKASMCEDDFLRAKHRERWQAGKHNGKQGHTWRVYGPMKDVRFERVFCPLVPTTHSFALPSGIHSANCFVSGTIADSFVDGSGSIMNRAAQAAQTMRMGGGIGYDFSTLRPSGALIKKLMSRSSGPLGFMPIFDAVCKATSSAGNRRGAQMGVLRVDHPDIASFIRAKQNTDQLTGFNISVAVTDVFMEAVAKQGTYKLRFGRQTYGEIEAAPIWEMLMRSTWDWAEPGVLFIDTINRLNNLWYCEKIAATNPCGEQPLPPYGACLLGSFNLARYIKRQIDGTHYFAWDQLLRDIPIVVRGMDNIIDRGVYPMHEQEQEGQNKRRMGLGVTGAANAIETLGHPYGTPGYVKMQDLILEFIRDKAYIASANLAAEKGAFPLYDAEQYQKGQFFKTLGDEAKEAVRRHGIRNSHLTSIAPTGTISMAADNISSGIEPVFSEITQRMVKVNGGEVPVEMEDYGLRVFGTKPKTAEKVTIDDHVNVLISAARRVDSAVSKTCNVPANTPWEEFKSVYMRAWEGGAKGCTTFNIGGKRMALLTGKPDVEEPAAPACEFDPDTGRRSCE